MFRHVQWLGWSPLLLSAAIALLSSGCCGGRGGSGYAGLRYDTACNGLCGDSGCHCVKGGPCRVACGDVPDCGCPEDGYEPACGCEGVGCGNSVGSAGAGCGLCSWFSRLWGCPGCSGEIYWSEWHNDPPGCEPCDCCGNWIGRTDDFTIACQPLPALAEQETEEVEDVGDESASAMVDYALEGDTIFR